MADVPGLGPAAAPPAFGGLLSGSSLSQAGALQPVGSHSSSSSSSSCSAPQCLLLSGHGAEGQSELAAATLKLLDSRAGRLLASSSQCRPLSIFAEQLGMQRAAVTGSGIKPRLHICAICKPHPECALQPVTLPLHPCFASPPPPPL
jgi:hypothetical protein